MTEGVTGSAGENIALSVHGDAGVLDLLVPDGASALDVSREYAKQVGATATPRLHDQRGSALPTDVALGDLGIRSGVVLVATYGGPPPAEASGRGDASGSEARALPGPLSGLVLGLAGVTGLLAGVFAALAGDVDEDLVVGLLLACALVAVLPVGRLARQRVVTAPVFGAAAALVLVWDPASARLPMVLGVTVLGGAVVAAVGRALTEEEDEVLRVWIVAGLAVFAVAGVGAVLGAPERIVWATLLLLSMFAGRFVPGVAVDVPDQALVDLDRLAVTAWSARDRTTSRRSRTVIRRPAVARVVERGSRIITAACAAVLVVTLVAAPMVLSTTRLSLDEIGAPLFVTCIGATQLLVARSYRHVAARLLLRVAGLWCLLCVLVVLVEKDFAGRVAVASVVLGVVVVLAAVATGRGWRSVWWSRRAEIAEALTGALAIPTFVVTVGLFRRIWEIVS